MTEEERKLLYDHTDSTNFKVTYCCEGKQIIKYLQLSEDDVLDSMEITGLPIQDTLWMLMLCRARELQQRMMDADMILGIQLIEPDFIDNWEEVL